MSGWATTKIKTLHGRYDSFCAEIGRLLGEPANVQSKKVSFGENVRELLNEASSLVRGALVLHSRNTETSIEGYFLDDPTRELDISTPYRRLVPEFHDDRDLKPRSLDSATFFAEVNLDTWWSREPDVIHFWLQPEAGISLVVICDREKAEQRQGLIKIRAEIQRRFYD